MYQIKIQISLRFLNMKFNKNYNIYVIIKNFFNFLIYNF